MALREKLMAIRHELAAAAQGEYDAWDADSDPEYGDGEVGFGGICQNIAGAMSDVLMRHGIDSYEMDSNGVGDQHVWTLAYDPTGVFHVDIHPGHYETGGGYNWKKIPGVTFTPDHISLSEEDRSILRELGVEDDEMGDGGDDTDYGRVDYANGSRMGKTRPRSALPTGEVPEFVLPDENPLVGRGSGFGRTGFLGTMIDSGFPVDEDDTYQSGFFPNGFDNVRFRHDRWAPAESLWTMHGGLTDMEVQGFAPPDVVKSVREASRHPELGHALGGYGAYVPQPPTYDDLVGSPMHPAVLADWLEEHAGNDPYGWGNRIRKDAQAGRKMFSPDNDYFVRAVSDKTPADFWDWPMNQPIGGDYLDGGEPEHLSRYADGSRMSGSIDSGSLGGYGQRHHDAEPDNLNSGFGHSSRQIRDEVDPWNLMQPGAFDRRARMSAQNEFFDEANRPSRELHSAIDAASRLNVHDAHAVADASRPFFGGKFPTYPSPGFLASTRPDQMHPLFLADWLDEQEQPDLSNHVGWSKPTPLAEHAANLRKWFGTYTPPTQASRYAEGHYSEGDRGLFNLDGMPHYDPHHPVGYAGPSSGNFEEPFAHMGAEPSFTRTVQDSGGSGLFLRPTRDKEFPDGGMSGFDEFPNMGFGDTGAGFRQPIDWKTLDAFADARWAPHKALHDALDAVESSGHADASAVGEAAYPSMNPPGVPAFRTGGGFTRHNPVPTARHLASREGQMHPLILADWLEENARDESDVQRAHELRRWFGHV